jgi:hypothetical protein
LGEFFLGPVLGLPSDLGLDELPSDLVPKGAGDRLQLGELGVT